MESTRRLALSCVLGIASVVAGCNGDPVTPGTDAGPRDSGMTVEEDSSTPVDSGTPQDSGPLPDGSMPDAGPPLPAYCPTLPAVGAEPTCPASPAIVEVASADDLEQSGDLNWTCANVYHLRNTLFMMSGTLNIGAGTRIIGDNGAAIVITQGARINAVGTPTHPVVFTSAQAEGSAAAGDWGGVVLLGDAPINSTGMAGGTNAIEGLPATDTRGTYGGTDPAHDCGTIRYARIEYAGFRFGMNNELNGLTMGACGTETDIEAVQVHLGLDDGFEMFGGAPNLSFVVASGIDDDGLDWDFGYTGRIQFAVVDRLGLTAVGSSDPNGIEADNHPSAFDNTPRSDPGVWNVTLVGEPAQAAGIGAVLRRGTYARIRNIIMLDWPVVGVNVRDMQGISAAGTGLSITHSIFFNNGMGGTQPFAYGTGMTRTFDTVFDDAEHMNRVGMDPMLGTISDTDPNYVPPMGSPAATGGATPPAPFQTQATFVGAFGPGCPDWSAGWAAYPE